MVRACNRESTGPLGGSLDELMAAVGGAVTARHQGPAVSRALVRGREALAELVGRDLASCFEIQRSGPLGPRRLVGDLFVPLLVLLHAHRAGIDVSAAVEGLFADRKDIRYYRDFPDMPRDADDAALVLRAAVELGPGAIPAWARDEARQVVARCLDPSGTIAVWEDSAERWFGPSCAGVSARVIRALAPRVAPAAVRGLLASQAADGVFVAVHYPRPEVATSLAIEALGALRPTSRTATALATACGALMAAGRPDGSWAGSVVATSLAILALSAVGALTPERASRTAAYLADVQRWDGTWPASGLFVCPHPNGDMRPFGCVGLSTALAVDALGRLVDLLQKGDSES